MGAAADLHAVQQPAGAGAERVDLAVVAAAEPQYAAVGADAADVRRAAARDAPLAQRLAGLEREDADRALAAVGDEQAARVAGGVEAVSALAGGLEADLAPARAVDEPDTVGGHVGDVERLAVGRELDVLGHRA